MVVTVGIDVPKSTHCAVAVDEVGRQIGKPLTVRPTDAGHLQLLRWATRISEADSVVFAVEDSRHVSTRLERALLTAGATVKRVPPKLMAGARSSARTRGTSDPIETVAIARAALREPNLPLAEHSHASAEVKLLVDHREDLVATRTATQNRLRWYLHELDPELEPATRGLDRASELDRVQARLVALPAGMVRRTALELVADIRAVTARVNGLEKELRALTVALHRIGVTQIRLDGLGRSYDQRRRADGDTSMEAPRALKWRLARVVFQLLRPTDTTLAACPQRAA